MGGGEPRRAGRFRLARLLRPWSLVGVIFLAGAVFLASKLFPDSPPKRPVALYDGPYVQEDGRILTVPRSEGEISLFLAGDSIMMKPWSQNSEPSFLKMIEEVRAADVAIANLEMVVHEFKGYAQADSGGAWASGPPVIAEELAWAGIDMVGHANNHTFDFGSIGVLETLEHVSRAGLVLAGSGKDLQAARSPAYLEHAKGTVALISTASTFVPYGKASRSRPDLRGRPGLNPLTVRNELRIEITPATAERLRRFWQWRGKSSRQFLQPEFRLWGINVWVGDKHDVATGPRPDEADVAATLATIREAAAAAELVVVSAHAHHQRAWFEDFARQTIDAGADVFLAHGPHVMRGLEIYKGKPIIYSLGDFVFQIGQFTRQPVEAYDQFDLGDDATPWDLARKKSRDGTVGLPGSREPWEAVAAALRFKDGGLLELRLIPLDLGFTEPLQVRGRPRYADPELGRHIIEYFANRSRRFGTGVLYAEEHNFGLVKLD